jgi:putative endonuclease
MQTTAIGRKAEQAAKVYLEMRGFEIIEQNWRRSSGEVDIIARKNNVVHFVEVKYRANDNQGTGLDAITPTKLRQMRRAAWSWVDEHKYKGEYVLSAIEIGGPDFAVLTFVEDVF